MIFGYSIRLQPGGHGLVEAQVPILLEPMDPKVYFILLVSQVLAQRKPYLLIQNTGISIFLEVNYQEVRFQNVYLLLFSLL